VNTARAVLGALAFAAALSGLGCAGGTRPGTPPASAPARPRAPAVTVVAPAEFATALAERRQVLIANGERLREDEVGYYMDVQEARFRQVVSAGLRVSRREQTVVLSLPGQLTFSVNSAQLSDAARTALAAVARVLVEYRLSVVSLHGHTDDTGDPASNQRLSEQRALTVARYLIAEGVNPTRLVVAGYGSASPVADNTSDAGREANRRVELQIDPLRE